MWLLGSELANCKEVCRTRMTVVYPHPLLRDQSTAKLGCFISEQCTTTMTFVFNAVLAFCKPVHNTDLNHRGGGAG